MSDSNSSFHLFAILPPNFATTATILTPTFCPFSSLALREQNLTRAEAPLVQQASAVPVAQQSLSLEDLIDALTPPAVPSLAHARALASTLSSQSPLPRRAVLNPVLASLCDADSPVAVQAAGYDVLSAYCENNEASALATADRLSYFSLFLGSSNSWGPELWEPRFKALRALTRYGVDVVGIELDFLKVLKSWIEGAFEGLLRADGALERGERAERERSIDVLAKFLASVLHQPETIARIAEEGLAGILDFYAGLVDRSVLLLNKPSPQDRPSPSPLGEGQSSTPPKSSAQSHRRNHSSVSATSISSTSASMMPPHAKHPADIAISLYLDYLSSQLKTLPPRYLGNILPLLFRALAFCSSPLPRLSVLPHPAKKPTSEDKITETLNALFSGPYSTTCMLILKQHLFPPPTSLANGSAKAKHPVDNARRFRAIHTAMYTSLGAHRTFRNYVRRALATRLARAYISRESSLGYSPSGAPVHLNLERDLMERAWPKEDYTTSALGLGRNGWDAGRLGKVLTKSVEAWVGWKVDGVEEMDAEKIRIGKEDLLEEAAGVLKDIWQELDARGEDEKGGLDEEEACVVGETLEKLVEYVIPLRNRDGTPYILPISQSPTAPTPVLRSLSVLLSRDHSTPTSPLLSTILIHISDHLTDDETANLPRVMSEQHDLSPTSPEWLNNWQNLLGNSNLVSIRRPRTRRAVMETLQSVYEGVRDMKGYREPLADMVLEFCRRSLEERGDKDAADVAWKILGDEVVLRTVEGAHHDDDAVSKYIELLVSATSEEERDEGDDMGDGVSIVTVDHSPSPQVPSPSSIPSPNLSRSHSEHPVPAKDKEKDSGIMSIISSLTTGHTARSQSSPAQVVEEVQEESAVAHPPVDITPISRAVTVVCTLVSIFSQLTFTPFALEPGNIALAIHVYGILLNIITEGRSTRARLTALQFLMRLRADRDHRVYFTTETASHVTMLASLISRVRGGPSPAPEAQADQSPSEQPDLRRARPRYSKERDGRQLSRGRGTAGAPSRTTTTSRSRSRATTTMPRTPVSKPIVPLWQVPENLPFSVADVSPSEGLVSYHPDVSGPQPVLPISLYLNTIIGILEKESNWEIMSYVLCHLPVQLANKHLFCGPKAREATSGMLSVLGASILNGEMAAYLQDQSVKPRDAQGLAYHTLSVLVSYRRCFDLKQCHLLVEVFQNGLTFGQFSTIKCCLHALSLSAFELQSSMTKCLPRILEMLSQIMSGANVAVHILGFLFLIGHLPPLYANFTENDYKMVFGVALQYLQHYNRPDSSATQSWALSQHVRILSYTVVYIWFLALKLPDRPRHIPYITRQLLLANEGNGQIDDPTEVCFDWLARYTYASADPRPAPSVFNDILMNPPTEKATHAVLSEKTWVLGYNVVTIRTLVKRGWIEVLCRRPSGFTKFLCRTENAPLVGPGDVDPDLFSVPATLMMERSPGTALAPDREDTSAVKTEEVQAEVRHVFEKPDDDDLDTPVPNPITGYVWSGTAPSQRRKDVTIDPAFFSLQLSAYPERVDPSLVRTVTDPAAVSRFVTGLDRIPVIDTHKVGIMYVAPGQTEEAEILRNTHGSPAYARFLEGLGRLINLRGQVDVYAGGLDPDEDGEYAYAWWDDIGQILYHTATMMPTTEDDPQCNNKKRHIGNDYVRIVWNDSGRPYRFDTLATQFQFVNIVIEPHSLGPIAAFSNNLHENEYFKVNVQRAPGMTEFAPIGHFKLISAESLPIFVRLLSQLADWFASVFAHTQRDTVRLEMTTNWRRRLESIRRFKNQIPQPGEQPDPAQGVMGQEAVRDFTTTF
ncbi:putative rap/ran-GAP [Lyophyllum shimeji]|uniref:Rap/ran-GAP n=1 Tax=Lyophyllum shimeji TaxID=47721 RepID=A0A9P3PZW3_LYOSH|nr:putative rap/ran-GAP [Lyophyllum shimeji]